MATLSITKDMDVISKYVELVNQSLDSNSIYIRTKETLDALFQENNISNSDKAMLVGQVLTSLNTSLVNASMSTALQWATQEKEVSIKLLETAKQLDILDEEILLKQGQLKTIAIDNQNKQSEGLRTYGVATLLNGDVVSLSDAGKAYYDIELAKQGVSNAVVQHDVLLAQKDQTLATAQKIIADSYNNYGIYTYTMGDNGVTSITDNTPAGFVTLTDVQRSIAEEQAKGYAYNAWASAASGVASTVGVAITSQLDIFKEPTVNADGTTTGGGAGYVLLTNLIDTTTKLKNIPAPTF